ncbi:MAG: hypothetical protein Barrevirus31_5 [Barrevirus sp.]|uniref:Uncharacterized protein n=1 Tax=Barrevirus sp. TaxID=2487763 RepID=A0A3G4ZQX8_9VIRU|nr:MAG: hypothetical protein Barrevirus31_5 [Barrevirus sp.]
MSKPNLGLQLHIEPKPLEKIFKILSSRDNISEIELEIQSIIDADDILSNMTKRQRFDAIKKFIMEICKLISDEPLTQAKAGYIYAFFNEIYRYYGDDVLKCGTTGHVKKSLLSDAYIVPSQLKCASVLLRNKWLAESILFVLLEQYKIGSNREFFKCKLDIVENAIKEVEQLFATKSDDEIICQFETLFIRRYVSIMEKLQKLSIFYDIESKKNEKYIIKLINELMTPNMDLVAKILRDFICEKIPYTDSIIIINEVHKHFTSDTDLLENRDRIEMIDGIMKVVRKPSGKKY